MQLMQDGHVNRRVVFAHVMNQMSAKAGIRRHGKAAEVAMMAEFSQMKDLNIYEPLDPKKLTRTQKRRALRAITLIKQGVEMRQIKRAHRCRRATTTGTLRQIGDNFSYSGHRRPYVEHYDRCPRASGHRHCRHCGSLSKGQNG